MGRSKPRKPTRNQKDLIRKVGLDPADWLVLEEAASIMVLFHRNEKTSRVIMKAG